MANFQKVKLRYQKKILGEVVDFIDGDRGSNYPSQGDFFPTEYCLFLSTKNVPNRKFSFDEKIFITKEKDSLLRKGKLQRGDYILTTRGTVGNFAYYGENILFENLRINSGMVILRKKSDVLNEHFFQYYLSSDFFIKQMKSRVSGSAQPQLPIRDMISMEIVLPDIITQSNIASVLSAYDDLIENNEKRIKALEEMAQLLYIEWFVKFKFPNHASSKMIDTKTEHGLIPDGWEVVCVGDLLMTVKRKNKLPSNMYGLRGKYPIIDQGRDFIAGYTNDEDSIYNETLIVFGDHSRCLKYCNFIFACGADGTQLLKTNDSERMPQSLLYYITLNSGLQNFNYARHFKFLKSLRVIKPSKEIAQQFSVTMDIVFSEINILRDKNKILSRIRDLLIPQLVTGKRLLK